MDILEHFKTPIWIENKPEFVQSLNKASNKYITKAKNKIKNILKNMGILDYHIIQHN